MNKVRIIGGQWRSRVIKFEPVLALRPTPDRVRETIFNWLSPYIFGARCLDLFAGSGALSFESLSRGAAEVFAVDSDKTVARTLSLNKASLGAESLSIFCNRFPFPVAWQPFDIIFLDPPFHEGLYESALQWLIDHHLLKDNTLVYIESHMSISFSGWEGIKSSRAGQVHFGLFQQMS